MSTVESVKSSARTGVGEVRAALTHREPPDVNEPRSRVRRRRIVVIVALVLGATFQGLSLSSEPGDAVFYAYTAALAAVWALGAFFSRPIRLGRITWRGHRRRPVFTGILTGVALGAVFIVGGLVVRLIPPVKDLVTDVFAHATQGGLLIVLVIAVITGVTEEAFFRGALYSALGKHYPVIVSTLIYIVVTLASGNPMLGFAAIFLGLVTAIERYATGGVLAPMLTHAVWTLIVFGGLPPIFGV